MTNRTTTNRPPTLGTNPSLGPPRERPSPPTPNAPRRRWRGPWARAVRARTASATSSARESSRSTVCRGSRPRVSRRRRVSAAEVVPSRCSPCGAPRPKRRATPSCPRSRVPPRVPRVRTWLTRGAACSATRSGFWACTAPRSAATTTPAAAGASPTSSSTPRSPVAAPPTVRLTMTVHHPRTQPRFERLS